MGRDVSADGQLKHGLKNTISMGQENQFASKDSKHFQDTGHADN
jgi:hypothetical protein